MPDKFESLTTEHLRLMRDDIAALSQRMDDGFGDIRKRFRVLDTTLAVCVVTKSPPPKKSPNFGIK